MAINPFQGFTFNKSSDVRAAEDQQFQQMMKGGKDQARLATILQASNTLSGGTAQYREAKKTEQVLQDALSLTGEVKDDIQGQIDFQRNAQRLAIEANLPEIAMQATSNLAALTSAQEERSRIKAQEEDRTEKHGLEMEIAQDELDEANRRLLWDPKTGKAAMSVNMKNPEDLAKMQELQAQNPNLKLATHAQVFEFDADMLLLQARMKHDQEMELLKAKQEGGDVFDMVGGREYNKAGVNQLSMLQYANQTTELLARNPGAFTTGNDVSAQMSNLAVQGKSLVSQVFAGGTDEFEAMVRNRPTFAQITSAQKRALVMNFAYALATSREGGRLTDQDIDRAIVSLGFLDNPDPRAILTVMLDNVTAGRDNWENRSKIGNMREHIPSTYNTVREQYDMNVAAISGLLEQYGGRYDFGDDEARLKQSVGTATKVEDDDEDVVDVPHPVM